MKYKFIFSFIAVITLIAFFLIYLSSMYRNPKVLFKLTKTEVKYHKRRVKKCNDQNSVRRLAGYYDYVAKDEVKARYWYKQKGKETHKCQ